MYIIPEELIREFRRVRSNNYSENRGHIETLGFLIGYKFEDNLIGTNLFFPVQEATCSRVDDKGKSLRLTLRNLTCYFLSYNLFLGINGQDSITWAFDNFKSKRKEKPVL